MSVWKRAHASDQEQLVWNVDEDHQVDDQEMIGGGKVQPSRLVI